MHKLTLLALLPTALSAQVLLTDDFNDSTINPALWTVILPNGGSSVIENGGALTTAGRGILGSVAGFTSPYTISGSFTMNDSLEHFNVVFRTDLSAGDFGERRGIFVSFSNDGDQISIQRYSNAGDNELLAVKSYSLATSQSYSFEIMDTGSVVMLSIGGTLELTGSSNYSTGNKIGFYSREFGSTSTSVDSLTVTAIPEPATYSALIGFMAFGLVTIRRNGAPRGRKQNGA
jgi:hypothetical protein